MFTEKVCRAVNEQINNELFSSYSYLAMAAWCEHQQFTGAAHWLQLQSQEEYGHAMRLYRFLLDRNGEVRLAAIAEPGNKFGSLVEVFEKSLEQEQRVTAQIDALYELALNEKAFAALVEMEWFITEQVEEEKSAREVVHKLRMIKDDPAALLDFDRELGARVAGADEAGA